MLACANFVHAEYIHFLALHPRSLGFDQFAHAEPLLHLTDQLLLVAPPEVFGEESPPRLEDFVGGREVQSLVHQLHGEEVVSGLVSGRVVQHV